VTKRRTVVGACLSFFLGSGMPEVRGGSELSLEITKYFIWDSGTKVNVMT
jgi:hypothetical protein